MPTGDQLEVIYPNGEIRFYDLDAAKGIANIGRHPENDVVIEDPEVGLFQAVLDHRSTPYRLVALDPDKPMAVRGQPLLPNAPRELRNWDTIEINGHSIILLQAAEMGAIAEPEAAPPPTPTPATGLVGRLLGGRVPAGGPPAGAPPALVPSPAAEAARRAAAKGARLVTPPRDQPDEMIVADLREREWTVDVEQAATCQLSIANGGPIVATFAVSVEGLDPAWVQIFPPTVNLNEGERTEVTLIFMAPRSPSSRAGPHALSVVVTSPNYPEHSSRRGALLKVNPFYDFAVGELAPKQATAGVPQPTAQTLLHIANKGNDDATFQLEASDDEHACSFEFEVPGQAARLARQAQLRLPPAETDAIPIHVTALHRPLVGLRSQTHPFTVTASMVEGQQMPRSLLGQLKVRPLIGPLVLALLTLLLAALIVLIFQPTIESLSPPSVAVMAGTPVTLSWKASQFSSLRLETGEGAVIGNVEGPVGQKVVAPLENTHYYLRASNLLSQIAPQFFSPYKDAWVDVAPVKPFIRVFTASRDNILTGETVTLRWEVQNADEVTLTSNGNPETLRSTEYTGDRSLPLRVTTDFTLNAKNRYGEDKKPLKVAVSEPTPTPLPAPIVRRFNVAPLAVTQGQTVTLEWQVDGATSVNISPLGELSSLGSTLHAPPATTNYVLTAFNEAGGQRQKVIVGPITVIVNPAPTGTPAPLAPRIDYFTATPDEVTAGTEDADNISLAWSVTGDFTSIEISGMDQGTLSVGDRQGTISVGVSKTTLFVLTARNNALSTSATVTVKVNPPATPGPTATPKPTPTPTPGIDQFYPQTQSGGDIQKVSSDTYQVEAATSVKLVWVVRNTTKVTLIINNLSYERGSSGEFSLGPLYQRGDYTLQLDNGSKTIHIWIKPQAPPPSPYNVNGPTAPTTPFKITWDYDGGKIDSILYFRVYRSDSPPFTVFALAGDNITKTLPYEWPDTRSGCGRAYYVTARYVSYESTGPVQQDTAPSTNRFYTGPCATPTPTPKP